MTDQQTSRTNITEALRPSIYAAIDAELASACERLARLMDVPVEEVEEPPTPPASPDEPSHERFDEAIAIVEDSRLTHVHWAEWRRNGGKGDDMAGDLQHHEKAIAGYDKVLAVLREARAASASVPPLDVERLAEADYLARQGQSASAWPEQYAKYGIRGFFNDSDWEILERIATAYAAETPEPKP